MTRANTLAKALPLVQRVNQRMVLLLACLLVCALPAFSEPSITQSPATVTPGKSLTADAMGFLNVRSIRGPEWQIKKQKNADGLWTAKLEARGALVTEFGDCGDREDSMRFMLWPVNAPNPDALLVLRNAGGVHGPDALDIVSLKENYRTLLSLRTDFNLTRVEDLNGDGIPEIVGTSRRYADLLDIPREFGPKPTLVFAYRDDARQFLCQNYRFRKASMSAAEEQRRNFETSGVAKGKFKYEKWNEKSRSAMTNLLAWAVQACLQGEAESVWSYLNEFTTPDTASQIRSAIEDRLTDDLYYLAIKRTKKRDEAIQDITNPRTNVSTG